MRCVAWMVLGLMFSCVAMTRAQDMPAAGGTIPVAVLDFEGTLPGNPDLGKQIGDTLTAILSGEPGIRLVDRPTLSRALMEHELNLSGLVSATEATQVGQLVGAKILVAGRAFILDKQVFVTAKLMGTETSLVEAVIVRGPRDGDTAELVMQLAEKIRAKLTESGQRLIAAPPAKGGLPADLRDKLRAMATKPRVAIFTVEQHVSERMVADPPADTELRKLFVDCGFDVADVEEKDLKKEKVDVVVKAEGFSEMAARVGNLHSCLARVEVKAVRIDDSRTLFADRTSARAVDLAENIAGRKALQTATEEVAIKLLTALASELEAK